MRSYIILALMSCLRQFIGAHVHSEDIHVLHKTIDNTLEFCCIMSHIFNL